MNRPKEDEEQFVICIKNAGYPASLEVRKIYRVVSDPNAEADGFSRIIDESGEDYLYPAAYFMRIRLPKLARKALRIAS